ncbi:hypothetical protein ACFL47_09565 [Candidatus Latescibacterota bacterium]
MDSQPTVTIPKVPKKGSFTIVVDQDDKVKEIFEENNKVKL